MLLAAIQRASASSIRFTAKDYVIDTRLNCSSVWEKGIKKISGELHSGTVVKIISHPTAAASFTSDRGLDFQLMRSVGRPVSFDP